MSPPSLRERLPAGHLARFVLDAVEAIDLDAFYGSHRADGLLERPAHQRRGQRGAPLWDARRVSFVE